MASLLDLISQGDPATITDDAYLNRTLKLMDPQQLYPFAATPPPAL